MKCRSSNERAQDIPKPAQILTELDSYLQLEPPQRSDDCDQNDLIGLYLQCSMRSFIAQWLPLISQVGTLPSTRVESIILDSWRATRREMLKALNQTSYRSVLALYLFSQTPIPAGITRQEKMDGISGSVCMQMALAQVQELRARHNTIGKRLSIFQDPLESGQLNAHFVDLESRIH